MSRTLSELIAGTHELQALPATTVRLLSLLDDATAGADEVLAVIEKDPSLTANLLKLCNSAYYGLRGQVGTAREALVRLGNLAVMNLAFAASMGDILRGPLAAYRLERDSLWRHALATGVAAGHLAGAAGQGAMREQAFTGGLVHDIGKLVCNGPLREQLDQLPVAATSAEMAAAEGRILGFDHAEVGAALGRSWNFPPRLVRLVADHHAAAPGAAADADAAAATADVVVLARAVAGGNLLATAGGFGGGSAPVADEEREARLAGWGFAAADVAGIVARLPDDVNGLLGAFGGR